MMEGEEFSLEQEHDRIMADTEALLHALKTETPKDIAQDAINWADLHCIQANWIFYPDTRWQIIISEASPTAWHLQTYIAEALTTQGYSNVDVIMEW